MQRDQSSVGTSAQQVSFISYFLSLSSRMIAYTRGEGCSSSLRKWCPGRFLFQPFSFHKKVNLHFFTNDTLNVFLLLLIFHAHIHEKIDLYHYITSGPSICSSCFHFTPQEADLRHLTSSKDIIWAIYYYRLWNYDDPTIWQVFRVALSRAAVCLSNFFLQLLDFNGTRSCCLGMKVLQVL